MSKSKVINECRLIFGSEIFEQALQLEYGAIHHANIAAAARLLLQFSESPDKQAQIVSRLARPTALGLCRYLIEPFIGKDK